MLAWSGSTAQELDPYLNTLLYPMRIHVRYGFESEKMAEESGGSHSKDVLSKLAYVLSTLSAGSSSALGARVLLMSSAY